MKYCEECGAAMDDDALFCDACGAKCTTTAGNGGAGDEIVRGEGREMSSACTNPHTAIIAVLAVSVLVVAGGVIYVLTSGEDPRSEAAVSETEREFGAEVVSESEPGSVN